MQLNRLEEDVLRWVNAEYPNPDWQPDNPEVILPDDCPAPRASDIRQHFGEHLPATVEAAVNRLAQLGLLKCVHLHDPSSVKSVNVGGGKLLRMPLADGKLMKPAYLISHFGQQTLNGDSLQTTKRSTTMDILLSWSGRSSHEVALALKGCLPEVLPGCTPWVSSEDIAKGKRWSDELHKQLDKTRVTVVCITPENVQSPWIYYESGYIAAKLGDAAVCPYLLGVEGKLVGGTPLGLYQWTEADNKKETLKLVLSLHDLLNTKHDPTILEGNFNSKWPQLKRKLEKVAEGFQEVKAEVTRTEPPLSQQLSDEAKRLLSAACGESRQRGKLGYARARTSVIWAGEQEMNTPGDPRSEALWKSALDELWKHVLVVPIKPLGEVYEVTRKGWDVYDQLKSA